MIYEVDLIKYFTRWKLLQIGAFSEQGIMCNFEKNARCVECEV